MTIPTVRQLTANATADNLSIDDYRTIYEEIRSKMTIRQFVEQAQSQYSIAWWSKFERGQAQLTRAARNELRRLVGLPDLSPSVAEATAGVDPDARVYQIGDDAPDRVVLIGVPGELTLYINSHVEILDNLASRSDASVTAVTGRKKRANISLQPELYARLNQARQRAGKSWAEFLQTLLEYSDEH